MQDNIYEEYIRSVLGYPQNNNMFQENSQSYMLTNNFKNSELEACYPEIYKVVYPMVTTACQNNRENITRQLVDELTDEIYFAIEENGSISQNDRYENTKDKQNTSNYISKAQEVRKKENDNIIKQENRGEDRQLNRIRNRSLHDLIKILLIRELLRRPGGNHNRPPRPPFPGGGGRPPYPPRQPRYFNNEYDWYE